MAFFRRLLGKKQDLPGVALAKNLTSKDGSTEPSQEEMEQLYGHIRDGS